MDDILTSQIDLNYLDRLISAFTRGNILV